MFELLALFTGFGKEHVSYDSEKKLDEKTKKCKRCLRRIGLNHYHCPYCQSYDGVPCDFFY